jgi:hypothetical protein
MFSLCASKGEPRPSRDVEQENSDPKIMHELDRSRNMPTRRDERQILAGDLCRRLGYAVLRVRSTAVTALGAIAIGALI